MPNKLSGKVAIITGGGSGIGRATSILFAKEGAKVIIADISSESGKETVKNIEAQGGDSIYIKTDVSRALDVEKMIKDSVRTYGKLNILVNNAGVHDFGNAISMSEKAWDRVMNINLKGVFLCSKYSIPEMIKSGGGSIVNVSSMGGLGAFFNECAYCTSKAAVIALTKCMAIDFASSNIRVNCVCPGNTETMMVGGIFTTPKEYEYAIQRTPLGRFAKPEEIANSILYLASDDSSYITGSALIVDGGSSSALITGKLGWVKKPKE
ncbi:MAG: glucose 1-dehydrogenase [Candidatus Bathyarchaeia archaeon]